jgi:sterol 24-C-methyltransferase
MLSKAKFDFWKYRFATVARSLKTLYTLPAEKVDAFIKSYHVYDYDWADEKQLIADMGPDYCNKVNQQVIDWYCVLNHLCSIGQVEKMYIPPAMDLSKSIIENQKLIEKRMAQDLGAKKGSRLLDIGCGRGRVANHIASITGAHVTGINVDDTQLEEARKYAASSGRGDQLEFKRGNVNDFPFSFPDNSLDGIYQIQVFSLCRDLPRLFKELHRMLKPGAKLACLDWVTLPAYNPKDPYHADLMRRIKPLIGAIGSISNKQYADLLRQAGFEILVDEIPSINGLQAPLIDKADKFFTGLTKWVHRLVRFKLLPAHFKLMLDRLTQDGQALVDADNLRLVTTTYYFVAQKK